MAWTHRQRLIPTVMAAQALLNGTLGEAVIGADGCVTYTAGDKAGKEAPICVVACDASLGIWIQQS